MKIKIGQKTTNDLNQYCENENIKIIERLTSENKRLSKLLKEANDHHAKLWVSFLRQKEAITNCKFTLDNFNWGKNHARKKQRD